jgi:hypothetical protein
MRAATYQFNFSGGLLQRGFWLYVWEITRPKGAKLYYVGRTGDSSSLNAQSPFNRMGQHLGFAENSNMLRRYLEAHYIETERCSFHLAAYGPILGEVKDEKGHRNRRDFIAALEKALEEAMREAGYDVMNRVHCRIELNPQAFAQVRAAFATHFKKLAGKLGKMPVRRSPKRLGADVKNA